MKDTDKRNKIFYSMDLIDEKYIEEADPAKARRIRVIKRIAVTAACVILVLTAVNLWLFLPYTIDPPDISEYSGSEYYAVMQKINEMTCPKPIYKNNYDKYVISGSQIRKEPPLMGGLDDGVNSANGGYGSDYSSIQQTYVETTDNQVSGVIESDLIKRSDKYIYYMDYGVLKVFTVNGEDVELAGMYDICASKNYERSFDKYEFYLSLDCNTVTVIAPRDENHTDRYHEDDVCYVDLVSLDVSDPANIKEKNSVSIRGDYVSSRIIEGNILFVSSYHIYKPDFSDEKSFIPYIDTGNGAEYVKPENIFAVSNNDSSDINFANIYLLDEETFDTKDAVSFLGYSSDIYVSNSRIYLAEQYNDYKTKLFSETYRTVMTEITCVSYGEGTLKHEGMTSLKGYINDQYSMDEYENYIRIVTTTLVSTGSYADYEENTNASLYCINLDTWKIDATVEEFAPQDEIVRSVRFDKDKAYVCTSTNIQFTDPVFFFDLSDIHNITVKDTGTIDGYSTSLVDFGDGYLLGIGMLGRVHFKIEIYKETDTGVESVCEYDVSNTYYPTSYKSYFIDREKRLIGFSLDNYHYPAGKTERYVLLYFDGAELRELIDNGTRDMWPMDYVYKYDINADRGLYIDEYLYIFCHQRCGGVKVELPE